MAVNPNAFDLLLRETESLERATRIELAFSAWEAARWIREMKV